MVISKSDTASSLSSAFGLRTVTATDSASTISDRVTGSACCSDGHSCDTCEWPNSRLLMSTASCVVTVCGPAAALSDATAVLSGGDRSAGVVIASCIWYVGAKLRTISSLMTTWHACWHRCCCAEASESLSAASTSVTDSVEPGGPYSIDISGAEFTSEASPVQPSRTRALTSTLYAQIAI